MAWTTPMTFVANDPLTAAQLNTYLRDNLNETATAKAVHGGAMFFGSDPNELVERWAEAHRVNAIESTTATSFDDLATVGPEVTVETGTTAMVMWAGHMGNETINLACWMGYEVSGASSLSASIDRSISVDGMPAALGNNYLGLWCFDMRSDLTPGENTFTCKYQVSGGTGYFTNRMLAVWPF